MCNKLKWIAIILVAVGLDQASKYFALQNLEFRTPTAVMPSLNWTLNYNKGISFGLLNHQSSIIPFMLILVALALVIGFFIWLWNMPKTQFWQAFSVSLIIGGAIGNLIDRISLGYVVDFIDFYIGNWHWYTFNVADAFICIGAFMLAIYFYKQAPE